METKRSSEVDARLSWKEKMTQRASAIKPRVSRMMHSTSARLNGLRHNPAVLGGAAAAAGLAIGIAGRWMRHRAHAPTILVVEV